MEYMPLGDLKTFLMVSKRIEGFSRDDNYAAFNCASIPFIKHRKTLDR